MEQGCIRYERGVCIDCLAHYSLKAGTCQIEGCVKYSSGSSCEACDTDYETNPHGGCSFKNCLDWESGACLICKSGYKNQAGKCVSEPNFVCNS